MRFLPSQRLAFGFEESIDDHRVAFGFVAAGETRRLAINHRRSGIDRGKAAIRKDDLAPVGYASWIDRTMTRLQWNAGSGPVLTGKSVGAAAAFCPVNGDAGKNALVSRCRRRRVIPLFFRRDGLLPGRGRERQGHDKKRGGGEESLHLINFSRAWAFQARKGLKRLVLRFLRAMLPPVGFVFRGSKTLNSARSSLTGGS